MVHAMLTFCVYLFGCWSTALPTLSSRPSAQFALHHRIFFSGSMECESSLIGFEFSFFIFHGLTVCGSVQENDYYFREWV